MAQWDGFRAEVKRQRTTQEWVANQAGVSLNTLHGKIAKDREPSLTEALAFSLILRVPPERLFPELVPSGFDEALGSDPWIHDHRQLIDDLKALRPDQLATLAAVARVQVEANGAEPARKLPDFEAGIRLAQQKAREQKTVKTES